jgi:AcrR family transcriptional regulator
MRKLRQSSAARKTILSAADGDWRAVLDEACQFARSQQQHLHQDRSRQRSEEILSAAVRVFAREGLARARISDIAAEAGVPPPSIYDYFTSKEELAYAIPIRRQGEFFEEFSDSLKKLNDTRQRLRHFLWLTVDFARRHPDWACVLYLEIWPSVLVKEERVGHILDAYSLILIGLIREGADKGEWPSDPNPYQTTAILTGGISHLIITWLLYRKPRDAVRAAGPMIDRMMLLLGQPVPERSKKAANHQDENRKNVGTPGKRKTPAR